MKTYTVHIIFRLLYLFFLLMLTHNALIVSSASRFGTVSNLIVCGLLWCFFFTITYKVSIGPNNEITAVSMFRRFHIKKEDIQSVSPGLAYIKIRSAKGTIRVPDMLEGVGNTESLFGVPPKPALPPIETSDTKWFTPGLVLFVLLILVSPVFLIWLFYDQNGGGLLLSWSEILMRHKVELFLNARFSPLEYLCVLGILVVSFIDTILLIVVKLCKIPLPQPDSNALFAGRDWRMIGARTCVILGLILLDQLLSDNVLFRESLFLFAAAGLSVLFLRSTISNIFCRQRNNS